MLLWGTAYECRQDTVRQITDFVPWTSFSCIVDHNAGVRRMTCAEQFRVLAFTQLTWLESLRYIETTLGANANKLYAVDLCHRVRRSTLADANELRDWRIWSDLRSTHHVEWVLLQ